MKTVVLIIAFILCCMFPPGFVVLVPYVCYKIAMICGGYFLTRTQVEKIYLEESAIYRYRHATREERAACDVLNEEWALEHGVIMDRSS